VVIEVPKENQKTVVDAMYSKFGIAASTSGGLRLCPHIYNTRAHIMRAINCVATMRDQGLKPTPRQGRKQWRKR
jgi:hypothetical protein